MVGDYQFDLEELIKFEINYNNLTQTCISKCRKQTGLHMLNLLLSIPGPVHILVVGAGALGLWTVRMARHILVNDPKLIHLSVGDTSVSTATGRKHSVFYVTGTEVLISTWVCYNGITMC